MVRLEQFYPFPEKQINSIIEKYSDAKEVIWAQEEPENMGGWSFVMRHFEGVNLRLISRLSSASPASGSSKVFAKRQAAIINEVFEK